ncbi:DUF29 domain-containing protein [Methylobacterium bullatum]|uniref:DUF29 domain-containing protein n=1 Tax=Methylobacterium bullatum TaxID=570505 RepID=A0A679JPH5_9HYPH|nr:hypothetical protein MBLL_01191 [Methylobacterium bullatum]
MSILSHKAESPSPAVPRSSRHQDDLYGWVQEQVALLRAGAVASLDLDNIAEELSDVGAEQYDKLESALEVLLMHLLKWDHQPERRSPIWALTVIEQRKRIEKLLRKNPGLTPRISEAVEDGFDLGRVRAAREMKRDLDTLPTPCPYDWTAIMTRVVSLDSD